MKKESRFLCLLTLFLTFLKVGALTFGGGYAMIPIIHKEVVEKKKWLRQNDLLDILAISESTPGPIAVNTATYVGYQVAGFWGSLFATLGLAIPSFVIILIISTFYQTFMSISVINAAFKGIRAGVIILLINAVFKLKKTVKFDAVAIILFAITLIGSLLSLFLNFEIKIGTFKVSLSILFILMGMIIGIISTALSKKGGQKE